MDVHKHLFEDLLKSSQPGPPNWVLIRQFLEANPDAIRMKDNILDKNLLHYACENLAPLELVQYLCHTWKDIVAQKTRLQDETLKHEFPHIHRYLPLHAACQNKQSVDVISFLIEQYPESVRQRTRYGWYPIQYAVSGQQSLEVIRYLIDQWPECGMIRFDQQDSYRVCHGVEQKKENGVGSGVGGYLVHDLMKYINPDANIPLLRHLVQLYPETYCTPNERGCYPVQVAITHHQPFDVIMTLIQLWPECVQVPMMEKGVEPHGYLVHYAMFHHNIPLVHYLLGSFPETVRQRNPAGQTIFQAMKESGTTENLLYTLILNCPTIDDTTSNYNSFCSHIRETDMKVQACFQRLYDHEEQLKTIIMMMNHQNDSNETDHRIVPSSLHALSHHHHHPRFHHHHHLQLKDTNVDQSTMKQLHSTKVFTWSKNNITACCIVVLLTMLVTVVGYGLFVVHNNSAPMRAPLVQCTTTTPTTNTLWNTRTTTTTTTTPIIIIDSITANTERSSFHPHNNNHHHQHPNMVAWWLDCIPVGAIYDSISRRRTYPHYFSYMNAGNDGGLSPPSLTIITNTTTTAGGVVVLVIVMIQFLLILVLFIMGFILWHHRRRDDGKSSN